MSLVRRWFPSFDGAAHVSPYLYVPPKRRWWPTLLAFAVGGACALALLGPSQKPAGVAGTEKPERPLVLQVRPGDAVSARDLASPPAVAIESSSEQQAQSTASAGESHGSLPPGTPQQPSAADAGAPASAMASVENANPRLPPETRIIATPARPPVAKRYAVQAAPKPSAHRHVAKKSRRYEAPSDGYAYDYSGYRRYRFAGERAYGGYWGAPSGYYGQRGGWFAGVN
jgi:hypothetical protein